MGLLEQGAALERQGGFLQSFCQWVAVPVLPTLGVLSSIITKLLLFGLKHRGGGPWEALNNLEV